MTLLILGGLCVGVSVVVFSNSLLTSVETYFNKTLLFVFTNLGFALTLPFFKELGVQNKSLVYFVSHISIASYSMYLIHISFVIPLLQNYLPNDLPWYMLYFLYLAFNLALSTLVYKYYEKPLTSLREKFTAEARTYLASPAKGLA